MVIIKDIPKKTFQHFPRSFCFNKQQKLTRGGTKERVLFGPNGHQLQIPWYSAEVAAKSIPRWFKPDLLLELLSSNKIHIKKCVPYLHWQDQSAVLIK
jgi:hypothetical protein